MWWGVFFSQGLLHVIHPSWLPTLKTNLRTSPLRYPTIYPSFRVVKVLLLRVYPNLVFTFWPSRSCEQWLSGSVVRTGFEPVWYVPPHLPSDILGNCLRETVWLASTNFATWLFTPPWDYWWVVISVFYFLKTCEASLIKNSQQLLGGGVSLSFIPTKSHSRRRHSAESFLKSWFEDSEYLLLIVVRTGFEPVISPTYCKRALPISYLTIKKGSESSLH